MVANLLMFGVSKAAHLSKEIRFDMAGEQNKMAALMQAMFSPLCPCFLVF